MNPGLPSAQAELGLTTGDHYINALTRAKQQRLAGGGAAAPAPQPPQQPPPSQQQRPAIDPYTGRPQGQPFGVPPPAAYQQPPPPPPVQQQQQQWASMPPPPPPPAPPAYQPPRAPDAALLASMQQLEGQLQAHRAGGPGGRLQGVVRAFCMCFVCMDAIS